MSIPHVLSLFSQYDSHNSISIVFCKDAQLLSSLSPTSALCFFYLQRFLVQIIYLFSSSQKYFHLPSFWIPLQCLYASPTVKLKIFKWKLFLCR